MTLLVWAAWGIAGAFIYAAPKLLISLSEDEVDGNPHRARHIAAFVLALTFGPIAGAGFGPLLAAEFHRTSLAELRAIAIVVGMVANPVAPQVVHLVSDTILRRLNAPLSPVRQRSRK